MQIVSYWAIFIFLDDMASSFNRLATTTSDLQPGSMASIPTLLSFRYSEFGRAIPTKSAPKDLAYSLTSYSKDVLIPLKPSFSDFLTLSIDLEP